MNTVQMIATADSNLGARTFVKDEWLEVLPAEAASLQYRKVARFPRIGEVQHRAVIETPQIQKVPPAPAAASRSPRTRSPKSPNARSSRKKTEPASGS